MRNNNNKSSFMLTLVEWWLWRIFAVKLCKRHLSSFHNQSWFEPGFYMKGFREDRISIKFDMTVYKLLTYSLSFLWTKNYSFNRYYMPSIISWTALKMSITVEMHNIACSIYWYNLTAFRNSEFSCIGSNDNYQVPSNLF